MAAFSTIPGRREIGQRAGCSPSWPVGIAGRGKIGGDKAFLQVVFDFSHVPDEPFPLDEHSLITVTGSSRRNPIWVWIAWGGAV